jgi:hypothetical protein
LLAIGDFWQPADRARDAFPTVTGSAGVHQRSGRFARVQMCSGIIDRPCFCAECQVHSPSAERTYPRSGRGMRPPHLQASLRSLQQRAITRPDSRRTVQGAPSRAERAGPAGGGATGPGASRSGHCPSSGGGPRDGQVTDGSGCSPFFRPSGSPSECKRLGESVHAPERASTSTGSVPCPRPGQGQDRKPAQRER